MINPAIAQRARDIRFRKVYAEIWSGITFDLLAVGKAALAKGIDTGSPTTTYPRSGGLFHDDHPLRIFHTMRWDEMPRDMRAELRRSVDEYLGVEPQARGLARLEWLFGWVKR